MSMRLVLLVERSRGGAEGLPECPVKGGVIGKARFLRSPDHRCSSPDKPGGIKQPLLPDVGVDGGAGLTFEQAHKMIPAQI